LLETIYSQVPAAIAVLVVAFALLKGDEPERLGAASYAIVTLASLVIPDGAPRSGPMWSLMALDFVALAVFVGLAWYSRRTWPVWCAAFQGIIVTGHVLLALKLRPPINAFAAVNNLAIYAVLITMGVGTFWAWQERRAAGIEK
jgi:hypothetical protein